MSASWGKGVLGSAWGKLRRCTASFAEAVSASFHPAYKLTMRIALAYEAEEAFMFVRSGEVHMTDQEE